MIRKRFAHACFTDKASSSIYIAGSHGTQRDSTEKWTLTESENAWQPSANLPEAIYWSAAVSSNTDEFIGYIAGGYSWTRWTKNIYGLKRRQEEWITLNKTMKIERYGHSILNIPANQILGC